ncbi:MAG: dehydrogenase [Acidobacteriota bacterium]|nr:MAG: dehydrogenase [Acidobacteriota bacterium]
MGSNVSRSTPTVCISVHPFGDIDSPPLKLLREAGMRLVVNPLARRLTESELTTFLRDANVLIAGTEPITDQVISSAPQLGLIARVGIGLDNVDLTAARNRGITVTFTPDAPAPAVSELTCGMMLSLLRGIAKADRAVRLGEWQRILGRRLGDLTVGVIGVGRVGRRVIEHLRGFGSHILANDLEPDPTLETEFNINWTSKEQIYEEADIVTLHVPLTQTTRHLIGQVELATMKTDALLVNTSRGPVVDESCLVTALRENQIGGAALDVFEQEPYSGELTTFDNCLLTCHMGSMSRDCRTKMENESVEEVLRYARGESPNQPVPSDYL